jgi:hypothetical protein
LIQFILVITVITVIMALMAINARMANTLFPDDDASKKMWEETKKSEEKDKEEIAKEKKALSHVTLIGRAGRMARAARRMNERSLNKKAK